MTTLQLYYPAILVAVAVLAFLVGLIVGRVGAMRLVLSTLNQLIEIRERVREPATAMELPGLTLFRAMIRQRRI